MKNLIPTKQAATILEYTEDELLYQVQTNGVLEKHIDEETMSWQFDLQEVLDLKVVIDKRQSKESTEETTD